MVPGIGAGVIAAVYFADGGSTFITIILFCILITYMMISINENRRLREANELLNQKIMFVAERTDEQINEMANDVSDDMHELVLLIANKRDQED